jgi:uncharacterized protein
VWQEGAWPPPWRSARNPHSEDIAVIDWMLDRPRLALAILTLLFVVPGPLLLQLQLDNAPEAYFPKDAAAVQFDRSVRERFPQEQVLVALFEGDDLFEPQFLRSLHAAVRSLESHALVERVLSVTTADHIRAVPEGFAVETLVDPYDLDALSPQQWRERALSDRFAPGLLVSVDGRALSLVVRPHAMENSLQRLELEQTLRDEIRAQGLDPYLTAVAGHVALDVAQLRAMLNDTMAFIPATTAIGLLLLWWLFRRMLVVVLAAVTIGAVVNATLLLLVVAGKPYTLISSIIPPLLSALSIAMLMHLFNAVLHAAQRGLNGRARVRAALDAVARPTVFTALTTAAGLSSLAVSPIRPIETFGLVAAAGILAIAAVTLLVLPALILRYDRGTWIQPRRRGVQVLDRFTGSCARLATRRAGWVLAAAAGLLAVGLPQVRHVEVETDLYAFFPEDHPISEATRRVEDRLSGVMALEVVFDAADRDALHDPERLRAIQRVQRWLDQRPEVDYSLSLPDLVEQMHWAFHGEDPEYRTIPDDELLIAQYLLVYDGNDLHDVVDRDYQRARLLLNLNVHGANALNALIADIREYLEAEPPADLAWDLAGMGRLFADQERLLIQGQIRSLVAVSILLTVLMLLLWRSPGMAALSMIPNVSPVVLIFIVMGVLGIWLDMATAMIASVAVGIAVDDTIHILHGFLKRRRAGASPAWAIARTFRQSGRAVTATTIVLTAQFLVLGFSAFQPTASFGVLTALGLVTALLFDLLLLPAMLISAHRLAQRRRR